MSLYIKDTLIKSESSDKGDHKSSSKPKKFEQRGGSYVARVQIGYDKDNTPRYKYFKTQSEYQAYLENKTKKQGKHTDKDTNLETKVKQEHAESTNKTNNKHKKPSLYVKHDKDHDDDKDKKDDVKKSLSLFIVL